MLLVVLVFLAVSSVALFFVKRDQQTIWLLGLCFSFICMFVGIMIYLAKTGGLSPEQKMFLFFDTRIQRRLSYLIFPLRKLGYLIAIGRYLFPPFLLMVATHYSMLPAVLRLRRRSAAVFILPFLSLAVYYPEIFFRLVKGRFALQTVLMKLTQGWIFVYVALAAALIVKEYRDMTIPYLKKQFRYIMVFILSVTVQYVIYCTQDPLQVYQIYSVEYMRFSGRLYANSLMDVKGWYLFTGFTLAFVVLGFWNLKNYMVIDWKENREDLSVRRKFDTASMGVSVFVHSIKNQLLSNRVLYKKIRRELEEEQPDLAKLTSYVGMLDEVNESMLGRMEELYKSVRQSSIFLSPVRAERIADTTLSLFHKKYPDTDVEILGSLGESLLADEQHLSEALCNLLTNAHEAFLMSGKSRERLAMKIHAERLYVGFEVCDNGPGMTRQEQRRIYDPFYTSKNTNTNWGMGLHYVREIVRSHFGKLKLESRPGEGSSFFVAIPRYEPRQDLGGISSKGQSMIRRE